MRSPMLMLTAPPVAWKNEPWGRESTTVAPAWIMAAAASPVTPFARSVGANVCAATVAPAVVDAVAAAIRIPDSGASTNKCGHVHCFKNVGHVVLQGRCFDDTCDCSGADQKDGDADDFGETEFGVLNELFSLSGRDCTDGTADRKRDERVDCDPGERTESQHDDNDCRSEYCGKEAREIFAACTFKIRSLNLFTLLLYEDGGEDDCYSECADGGNDVAGHDGCQRLFKCF